MQRLRILSTAWSAALVPWLASATGTQTIDQDHGSSIGDPDGEPPVVRLRVHPGRVRTWIGSTGGPAPARVLPREELVFRGPATSDIPAGDAPEGDTPSGVAFTPDGAEILVAHAESKNVIVWDATSGAFVRAIPVSGSPLGLAVSSDGLHAVTPNGFEDTASILDLVSGAESAVIPVGNQPGVVAISPDGTTAAVGNTVDGSISIVDIAGATELRRVSGLGFLATLTINFENGSLGTRFTQFVFAGDGKIVHPDYFADRVRIVDVATGAVTSLLVPDGPEGVAAAPGGATVVVACGAADSVAVIDVPSATVTDTIAVGADVFGGAIALNPDASKAVVAVLNACRVVDLVTSGVSADIATASVEELYTTADGLYAFCVGFNGSLISYASESLVQHLNGVVNVARGAVSPVDPAAAGAGVNFGEDFLIFDTDGAGGSLVHHQLSGPAAEGDKARELAFSLDGALVAVTEILSDTVAIRDAATGALLHSVTAGDRPAEVAFTADGSLAVVANLDSAFASIVDVATGAETEVPISTRGSQVEISGDGAYAYVAVVTSDGVWRIDLATRTVAGPRLATGNMGSIGYLYSQTSGLELSHDGLTLAACGSFTNQLTLIDTTTWSVVANVPVPGFPVRAAFDAADDLIFVSSRDTDRVYVVSNAGPFSSVVTSYPAGDQPLDLALSRDGSRLYVAAFAAETVRVIDTATGSLLANIPLPDPPAGLRLSGDGDELYVATGNWTLTFGPGPLFSRSSTGQLSVIDTRTFAVRLEVDTGVTPAMLAYNGSTHRLAAPSTFIDGYTVLELPPRLRRL